MSRSTKSLATLSLALCCLEVTGCQYRSTKDTYVLIAPNLKLPYWKSVEEGFSAAGAEYKVTARADGPDRYDPAAEASALEDATRTHPAGILVSAADAGALGGAINSAISAGVPVITVDSDAPLSSRLFFIGTNNIEAGRLGGQRLVERLHGKGNVVFFSIPGQPNLEDRLKGYKDAFSNSPGMKIVEVAATASDSGTAFDRAGQYVNRTGPAKIDAFVSLESTSGNAIAEVLKRNSITDRVIIAMDVNDDTLNYIADGTIDSTISQKPFTMGYFGLKLLDEAHRSHHGAWRTNYSVDAHSPFPAFVDTGSTLITKYNVSAFQHPATAGSNP